MGEALGNQSFELSKGFRDRLKEAVGLEEEIPKDAFAEVDYHLDWVAAALIACKKGAVGELLELAEQRQGGKVFPNERSRKSKRWLVEGKQEDVDLFVAFKSNGIYHLILVEAKGYSGWDREQMLSKSARLKHIFGKGINGSKYSFVKPHFCLMSHTLPNPNSVAIDEWTDWMTNREKQPPYNWLKTNLPGNRLKAVRWDKGKCKRSQNGENLRIQPTREGISGPTQREQHKPNS